MPLRGLLAILAGFLSQMLSWGLIMTYGTILAFYVRFLVPRISTTLIALAGAIPPFCLLALALLWGRLLDAGHHHVLNTLAGLFLTCGLTGLAFTGEDEYNSGKYWAILLASIPMGIGQSIYFLAAPQMAKTWSSRHKGLAMGLTNCGAAVGGALWPLAFVYLVDGIGFRKAVAVLAGVACGLSMFIAFFAVPAPDFERRPINGIFELRTWWPTSAFHSKLFIVHTVSMAFVYLGVLTVPFFIELWARRNRDIGVSEDTSNGNGLDADSSPKMEFYLVITLNACQLPGRLFGSSLCDKFRARKIHVLACFAAVVIVGACWFEVSSFEGGEVFAAFFGLTLGVMVSLPINDIQDLLGDNRTQLMGQYAGVVYTCCCPFIVGGAVVAGALVKSFDVLIAPAAWCTVCFGLGGFGILVGLWMEDDTSCFEDDSRMGTSEHEGSTRRKSANGNAI